MFSFWSRVTESSPAEAFASRNKDGLLIDVRTPSEFSSGHAEGATSMPLATLAESAGALPRDRPIHLICASGNRSKTAVHILERAGFRKLASVRGGTSAWASTGLPMVRR